MLKSSDDYELDVARRLNGLDKHDLRVDQEIRTAQVEAILARASVVESLTAAVRNKNGSGSH